MVGAILMLGLYQVLCVYQLNSGIVGLIRGPRLPPVWVIAGDTVLFREDDSFHAWLAAPHFRC